MESACESGKNIVVCCDGTGNEFRDFNTNVVKLYTCLQINEDQRGYYHPGVGTMGAPNRSTRLGKLESQIAGLAIGAGFIDGIGDAYQYLMENYRDGDRIFLFGFSRGAYTVRALAGALLLYGLLCPGNEGHLPYVLQMYSQESRKAFNRKQKQTKLEESAISKAFKKTFSREVTIHFAGLWDTVSSVGWIYDPVKLLFDGQNPIVRKVRHAVSIDERRCFFQANLLGHPLPRAETPLLKGEQQDIVQVWFPGVHSDVGGGYIQAECGPAELALKWILEAAEKDCLLVNDAKKAAILGPHHPPAPEELTRFYPRPRHTRWQIHNSLTWQWWPLEIFPHKYFDANGKKRWQIIPKSHRREIPNGALLHPALLEYLEHEKDYEPKNVNKHYIEPLASSPVGAPVLPIPEVESKLAAAGVLVYRTHRDKSATHLKTMVQTGAAAAVAVLAAIKLFRR